MEYAELAFHTLTAAQRGQSLLHRYRIRCRLLRLSGSLGGGCRFGLRLHRRDAARAAALLCAAGLPLADGVCDHDLS